MHKFKPGRPALKRGGPPGLKSNAPPLHPGGFFFCLVGSGDLLALPLRPLVSRCDRFRRPGKSSGPPPFAPSLNVQGDATHNGSRVFGDLTPSIAKQLPKVVRMAVGTTVFRIRIGLIFRRCWNLVTPPRSCGGVAGSGPRLNLLRRGIIFDSRPRLAQCEISVGGVSADLRARSSR
jgi:hypothetical protein